MMKKNPLTAFGIDRFLRQCWQKKPLVLRGVASTLAGELGRDDLIDLACRDDVESRLIQRKGRRWEVRHGPFRRRDFSPLPSRNWTLLVNGVDTLVPAARALQTSFDFIPLARHDDVMVSYAAPGGGVGPHFDSYDVFLLQGAGERRWQISHQRDLTLVDGAPLKILSRFQAQRDWLMQSGDLLYLPPNYAHHGVAVEECLTWSVGMRAPQQCEVMTHFLDYLQDHLTADSVYQDPDLKRQTHPAEISTQLRHGVHRMIDALHWSDKDIDLCLGEMMSEPRQNVVFSPPHHISEATFALHVSKRGLQLDTKTRMLFDRKTFFINGESTTIATADTPLLRKLADSRLLAPGSKLQRSTIAVLHRWYCAGYLEYDA